MLLFGVGSGIRGSSVHLIAVPIDYSENIRVLIAYGFVMALYLDWLGRTPTRERLTANMRGTHKETQIRFPVAGA
jgi:hypothetical protein